MITIWKVYWQDQEQFALESFRPLFNFRHPVGRSFNTILGHIRARAPAKRVRALARKTCALFHNKDCHKVRVWLQFYIQLVKKTTVSFTLRIWTLIGKKSDKSISRHFTNEKFRKQSYLFTCISPDYVGHENLRVLDFREFWRILILKIWELISLGGVKTHFGKLALKWCIFSHEKKTFQLILEGESQNLRLGYIIIINAFSIFNFLTKIDYKHKN